MRITQYSLVYMGVSLLAAPSAASSPEPLPSTTVGYCQRYLVLHKLPELTMVAPTAPDSSSSLVNQLGMKYPMRVNKDFPCDPQITNDVMSCVNMERRSILTQIEKTNQPTQKENIEIQAHQRVIDILKPIYEVSGCPAYVCTLAQYYVSRQADRDLQSQPEALAKAEAVSIKLSERCSTLPRNLVSEEIALNIQNSLPRKGKRTAAKTLKPAGIALMSVGAVGVLSSAIVMGLHQQMILGGGNDCLFGGIYRPCVYDTLTGGGIGLGVSLATVAGGVTLYFLGKRAAREYYKPEQP